tara:strand:+ start:3542 stop:4273 length:732 start_codon:yes stop_codon:yes gene_type:complete
MPEVLTGDRKDYRIRLLHLVGRFPIFSGENELGEAVLDEAINQALKQLSRDEPRVVIEDEVGDDGQYYPLTNLASWEDDFSRVVSIDYDVGTRVSSDEDPQFLNEDDGDWRFYRDEDTRYIYFPRHNPSSSVTLRYTYTARYTLIEGSSDIPSYLEDALLFLAFSLLCRIIQVRLEKASDPPGGAQYAIRNKGSGFKSIADTYWDLYVRERGGEEVEAASVSKEFDQRYLTGEQYTFHSGGNR